MIKNPLISVVMPLYNVEPYVGAAIDSVIQQNIGFSDNIEIILVNDGSSDGTAIVAKNYADKFPDNIVFKSQKNAGVSKARNTGLDLARGQYIHFFDADDVISKNFYKESINFLQSHREVDFVASRIKFFDKSIESHPLNFKFKTDTVIDVSETPENIILHLVSCVFRRYAFDNLKFDSAIRFSEDIKLLSEVLVDKKKYGVVAKTQYNYRKRVSGNSAIDGSHTDKDFYLITPRLVYESIIKDWTASGKTHPYIQNLLLYDLSYRISGAPYKFLSASEERDYAVEIQKILRQINTKCINKSPWYMPTQKQYLQKIKHQRSPEKFCFVDNSFVESIEPKHPLLAVLLNWRFSKAIEQYKKMRRYNLTLLSPKAKLFEYAKPWLVIIEAIVDIPRAVILRSWYHLSKSRKKREIWLVSDRPTAAGDNGEALFRYIVARRPNADVFFALSKRSSDSARLKTVGNVIDYGAWNYLVKFLLADKIISSHADIETTNPFFRNLDHYQDLIRHDFIFLQHGVIANDLSTWLSKKHQNIKLFITSSEAECNSIINNLAYGYGAAEVKITGLARWDQLKNNPKNKLIIAPTFRANLLNRPMKKDGTRDYDPTFKSSDYFKFYNNLIHDPKVNQALERRAMTGEFYVHPNFSQQIGDFSSSKNIKVVNFPYNYKKAVSEGNLLITDYSSLVYDFAYLGKPVIYAQFDKTKFYKSHSFSKGYFYDYKKDGFGPVADSYEATVSEATRYIKAGCKTEPNYKQRSDKFFKFRDNKNCQRIYTDIIVNNR